MKAVNLIPADEARGGGGGAGHSGGGAYAILALLALAVVLVAAWTHFDSTERQRKAEVSRLQAEATAAEAQAAGLKDYTEFGNRRASRVETVRNLAKSRFDWPHALRDVARTVPASAWVISMRATVSPTVTVEGSPDPLRQALAVPAIEVGGCARTQTDVARTVAAMRRVDGVTRVSLSSSTQGSGGDSGACGDNVPAGSPKFSMTVFFNAPTGTAATGTAGAATTTTSGGTTP